MKLSLDAVQRLRAAALVLAIGIALILAWDRLGAWHDGWYTSVGSAELAAERCAEHERWGGAGWAVADDDACATYANDPKRYLEAAGAALRGEAAAENRRRAVGARRAVLRDLGEALQRCLVLIAATVAVWILIPLLGPYARESARSGALDR